MEPATILSLTAIVMSIVALVTTRPISWLWDRCLPPQTAADPSILSRLEDLKNSLEQRLFQVDQRLFALEEWQDAEIILLSQNVPPPPNAASAATRRDSEGDPLPRM